MRLPHVIGIVWSEAGYSVIPLSSLAENYHILFYDSHVSRKCIVVYLFSKKSYRDHMAMQFDLWELPIFVETWAL